MSRALTACALEPAPGAVFAVLGTRVEAVGDVPSETRDLVAVTALGARAHIHIAVHRGSFERRAAGELALQAHITGGRASVHRTRTVERKAQRSVHGAHFDVQIGRASCRERG